MRCCSRVGLTAHFAVEDERVDDAGCYFAHAHAHVVAEAWQLQAADDSGGVKCVSALSVKFLCSGRNSCCVRLERNWGCERSRRWWRQAKDAAVSQQQQQRVFGDSVPVL